MELEWIDDFLVLCQTRNFTRAAESRCTTQSAFSRRVQRMEDWLGAPLFNREARPLTLTPAGEAFYERAQRLRGDIFDARRAVLSASSVFKTSQRIYTTNTLAATVLSRWVAERRLENYSLIVASISGCIEAVRRKHAHIALIPELGAEDALQGLDVQALGDDRLMLVAQKRLAQTVVLRDRRLEGSLMVYTPGTSYGAAIGAMLARHGVEIADPPVCESASAEALLAQVVAGLGAAWVPESLARGAAVTRCRTPPFFDIAYRIVLVRPPAG